MVCFLYSLLGILPVFCSQKDLAKLRTSFPFDQIVFHNFCSIDGGVLVANLFPTHTGNKTCLNVWINFQKREYWKSSVCKEKLIVAEDRDLKCFLSPAHLKVAQNTNFRTVKFASTGCSMVVTFYKGGKVYKVW